MTKMDQTDAMVVKDTSDATAKSEASSSKPGNSKSTDFSLQPQDYDFSHSRRGKALIVNNRNFNFIKTNQHDRDGTDVDAEALESLFVRMGFDVERCDNMTVTDMSIKFRELGSREDHSDADCFVCAILSHGEEGLVYGTDGKLRLENIVKNFKGDACPTLVEKPKIFFIQACRGRKYDWGVEVADADVPDASLDGPSVKKIPIESDFLMAYSVSPGYFSWRNNVDGSWFIQAVTQVMMEHHETMELFDMMKIVSRKVAYDFQSCTDDDFTSEMKQMPCMVSTLTRNVCFKPKY